MPFCPPVETTIAHEPSLLLKHQLAERAGCRACLRPTVDSFNAVSWLSCKQSRIYIAFYCLRLVNSRGRLQDRIFKLSQGRPSHLLSSLLKGCNKKSKAH